MKESYAKEFTKQAPRDAPRQWNWAPFRVKYPTLPKRKKYCCDVCKRAKLENSLWRCVHCGSEACQHMFQKGRVDTRRVDGTGVCHRCRRARQAAFNKHFKLGSKESEVPPEEED